MKKAQLFLIVFLLCGGSFSQDNKPSFTIGDTDCGDSTVESQFYENRSGKVVKILSANKILFQQKIIDGNNESGEFIVNLVGIDSKINKQGIKSFLKKFILNKEVEITGNLGNKSKKEFSGLIFVASDSDEVDWINENLLAMGIAKYKPFESNNLVSYTKPCELQKAEERAREAKLGIWAK